MTHTDFRGAPSYVDIYIYSDALTQQEVQAVMGSKGGGIRNLNSDYKWCWSGPRNEYDDAAQSVRDFLENVFLKIQPGIEKMQKDYKAEADLHLVIGIARVIKNGEWPDINLDPTTLGVLGQNNISLNIYFEQQIS
jgi:hypothetical protein